MYYIIEIYEPPKVNKHVKEIVFDDKNWKLFCNFHIEIEKIENYEKEEKG